jgi:hypothetical protein
LAKPCPAYCGAIRAAAISTKEQQDGAGYCELACLFGNVCDRFRRDCQGVLRAKPPPPSIAEAIFGYQRLSRWLNAALKRE